MLFMAVFFNAIVVTYWETISLDQLVAFRVILMQISYLKAILVRKNNLEYSFSVEYGVIFLQSMLI